MILTNILESTAKKYPTKAALTMRMGYRTTSLTYQEVYDFSLRIAHFLEKNGVGEGDNVLILAPNSPYWICVFWGTLLRGARIVPLNTQMTSETIQKIANQTEATILFKHVHLKPNLSKNLKIYDIEFLKEYVEESAPTLRRESRPEGIGEDDVVQILYTSGTTGDPKGVILTHRNLSSNLEALTKLIPISTSDRFLSILPLSHILEQMVGFLLPFQTGAHIVYAYSPAAIRDLLKEHHITKMVAVPEFLRVVMSRLEVGVEKKGRKAMFEKMLKQSNNINVKFLQRILFRSVHMELGGKFRTVASGGTTLDIELEKKWNALGIDLLQGYGLTETSPIISMNTYKDHRLGSVGKVLSGVNVKIARDGEILVKGPNVFQGYFKDEQKTKAVFQNEWFKTGDIGELDQDGFLYIKGRKKYMIKGPGAQNVYPEDIEFKLNKIQGVEDSCVVGRDMQSGLVEIHAVLLGDFDKPEKIIQEANKNLASYQQITGWSLWPKEDFPRSATQKVKKEEVIRWLKEKEVDESPRGAQGKTTPLIRLLADVTGIDVFQITPDTKIVSELNLDSLLRIELVSRIEEKFGVVIAETKIDPSTTISDLQTMIEKKEISTEKLQFRKWPLSWWASLDRMLDQTLWVFPFIRIFVKLRIEGKENLNNLALPAIFMPNHISYLDSLVILMALPFRIRKKIAFAAAYDVTYGIYKRWSWLAEWLFNSFPFPRRTGENIKLGLDYMGRLLDKGWSVVVYPEGQMSKSGKLLPLKRGAGLVAVEMDVPIVPVKIMGTSNIVPYAKFMPRRRGIVTIKFGKPLTFSRRDSYIQATEKIHEALQDL